MKLINGAQFLNIHYSLVLFTSTPAAAVFGTVVALTCMYASLYLHKFDPIIKVLNSFFFFFLVLSKFLCNNKYQTKIERNKF